MKDERLRRLFRDYPAGRLSEAETQEFFALVRQPENALTLEELMQEFSMPAPPYRDMDTQAATAILESVTGDSLSVSAPVHRIHFLKRGWVRVAVAAVFVLCAVSVWMLADRRTTTAPQQTAQLTDVQAPQQNKAMITLSDGKKILVDSLSKLNQGDVQLMKDANGNIIYSGAATEIAYNTLDNPRGSQVVNIVLADGTKVWLNAESSITYPIAFTGNTRRVKITGEAYFEVMHDAKHPFIAQTRTDAIEVLGTHFNINAYNDEGEVKTTLLEGSVKVNTTVIKPGEQYDGGKVKKVNSETAIAWMKGFFQFDDADLKTVMRQIGRWYDVQVVYEGNDADRTFSGGIDRNLHLSQVLEILSTSKINYTIENKRLTIKP